MQNMNNHGGCVIEELEEDGISMEGVVNKEHMMMGNMVHDEDEVFGEDVDFEARIGLEHYFQTDTYMAGHEVN
ncbi:hypothetical protein M5689_011420 [Euphorbia peplus]|nr:hypothetical protein M5689_011420 [Euphorbia peplus]